MIAIGSHTNLDEFIDTSFHARLDLDELLCDYDHEVLSDPPKLAFIKYWERILKVIYHYKNKLSTGGYVFIRPINHIRTLFKLY